MSPAGISDFSSVLDRMQPAPGHPWATRTVGLCMVVHDAAAEIERCLASVLPHITHWVIVDTGSTDGTRDRIRELLADVPGELIERPSSGYGQDRTDALRSARRAARYSLLLEQYETLAPDSEFSWPELTADSASVRTRRAGQVSWRKRLVANRVPWRDRGVTTSSLEGEGASSELHLTDLQIIDHRVGMIDHLRDVQAVQAALQVDPGNAGLHHELATACRRAGQDEAAAAAYRRALAAGGTAEQVADSMLWTARYLERSDGAPERVIQAYLKAWESLPDRAEPLVDLARFCRNQNRFGLGRMAAGQAITIPLPREAGWMDEEAYTWRCLDEYAVASYWTDRFADCAWACRQLLDAGSVPEEQRGRIEGNLAAALDKLGDSEGSAAVHLPRVPRQMPPVHESVLESVYQPVQEAEQEPEPAPVHEAVHEPVEEPVHEPIQEPVDESVPEPVAEPVVPSVAVERVCAAPAVDVIELLNPGRLTSIVAVGATNGAGIPSGENLVERQLCRVTGFEPSGELYGTLCEQADPTHTYLPFALGDGADRTVWLAAPGGVDTGRPGDPRVTELFDLPASTGSCHTTSMPTRRLDDVSEIEDIDLLTIDLHGADLSVIRHGRAKLSSAVAVAARCPFVATHPDQATMGELDAALRALGFIAHAITSMTRTAIKPYASSGDRLGSVLNQILEAELIYVRDFTRPELMSDEQLTQLAIIAHHAWGSYDLALRCVLQLELRGAVPLDSAQRYLPGAPANLS